MHQNKAATASGGSLHQNKVATASGGSLHQNKAATASPELAEGGLSKCCVLCGNEVIQQLLRYGNLGATERQFLCEHFGKYVPEDSYICKKHWIEAKRYHSNPNYIPKWKSIPNIQTSPKSCIHPQCTNKFSDKLFKPAFATINELTRGVARATIIYKYSISFVPMLLHQSLSSF